MWTRAVWMEEEKEMEGTLPAVWIEGSFLRWPRKNVERCMKEHTPPEDSWHKFTIKKIKITDGQLLFPIHSSVAHLQLWDDTHFVSFINLCNVWKCIKSLHIHNRYYIPSLFVRVQLHQFLDFHFIIAAKRKVCERVAETSSVETVSEEEENYFTSRKKNPPKHLNDYQSGMLQMRTLVFINTWKSTKICDWSHLLLLQVISHYP